MSTQRPQPDQQQDEPERWTWRMYAFFIVMPGIVLWRILREIWPDRFQ